MSLSLQYSTMIHGSKPNHLGRTCQSRISCTSVKMGKQVQTNFYQLLSLESQEASVAEIKQAYRRMARVYHPDVCPPSRKEESTQIFLQLHKAYETLSDPILRINHDRQLMGLKNGPEPRWENQLSGLKMRSDLRMRSKSRSSKTGSTA